METVKISVRSPAKIGVGIGSRSGGSVPVYTGSYSVVPKAEEAVVLQTANKLLSENVTVSRVPYYETANQSGGKTFIIGEVQNV